MRHRVRPGFGALLISAALVVVLPGKVDAFSAPDAGVAWEPPALPTPTYDVQPPSVDPSQVRWVTAGDGTQLYTETYLPAPLDGEVPPDRVPVIVVYTPYAAPGAPDFAPAVDLFVPRGYAVTFAHVRGSGGSEGCIAQTNRFEVDDGARVIEDAGSLAPWSSGAVGMYGVSYPGGTQVATATGPDRERLQYLKAIAPGAPVASGYEFFHHDGVPHLLQGTASSLAYFGLLSNPQARPELLLDRLSCAPDVLSGATDQSGNYTPFYEARDHTRHLERLHAATLVFYGHADRRVSPLMTAGFFDAIPASTPHVGFFGVWDHELPDDYRFNGPNLDSPRADWERSDWDAIVYAWMERHVRGVDNGIDDWPTAQVQGTDGQWRTASTWPAVPGPAMNLPLGPSGELGSVCPTGRTQYLEVPSPELEAENAPSDLPGTSAVFTTAPFPERAEFIGTQWVNLWVELVLPDSHITARLEALDPNGDLHIPEARTIGARSAQHLEPLDRDRFRQRAAEPAPTGEPFLVQLRFNPTDLVVPAGGRLRLTVAGSSIAFDGLDGLSEGAGFLFQGPTAPSGLTQPVSIVHDEEHPSTVRLTLPEPDSQLLDIREFDQENEPLGRTAAGPSVDGGLTATGPESCRTDATGTDPAYIPREDASFSAPPVAYSVTAGSDRRPTPAETRTGCSPSCCSAPVLASPSGGDGGARSRRRCPMRHRTGEDPWPICNHGA